MSRKLFVFAFLLLHAPSANAQLPKDVERTQDTFTGDTIYATKYGRLDDPHGCGRSNIAIVLDVVRSEKTGRSGERLSYQWIDVDGPLHKSRYLGAVAAALNIDGDLVEIESTRMPPKLAGGARESDEAGFYFLPTGTVARIANAKSVKLRIAGTELTCDGTLEANVQQRAKALVDYLAR